MQQRYHGNVKVLPFNKGCANKVFYSSIAEFSPIPSYLQKLVVKSNHINQNKIDIAPYVHADSEALKVFKVDNPDIIKTC